MFEKIKKKQEAEKTVPQVKGKTFTELVSQELDAEMDKLGKVEKELEKGINEVLGAIKEKGSNAELVSIVVSLRQKLEVNAKEQKQARVKYAVEPGLQMMASELDRADGTNRGIDLFRAIGPLVNNILAALPEIERCYGGAYFAPILYTQIKQEMGVLAQQFNCELPKLHRVDKKALEQKLNDRMEILGKSKMESQGLAHKFKNL
jgi:hypothetical protein